MKARLSDVAGRAGVSEATVSRVLNDRPGVAETTRQRVLTALEVLGYEPPLRLRAKRAGLVGVIVPELDNPIFPLLAQEIELALSHRGYTPVLCTHSIGGVHEDTYVQALLDRGVSGIIFVSGIHAVANSDPARYTALVDRGLPIVLVNGHLPDVDAPSISNDDAAAVELAVDHLAQLGHRSIGLAVGPPRYTPVIRKTAGFRAAMRKHPGIDDEDVDKLIETAVFTVEGGTAAAHALLDRGATALVCGSDLMALGATRAARQRGLQVPADVSIIGSDDSTLIEFTDPPLTTVRQPVRAMGLAAVDALLDDIAGTPAPRTELIFRPELVVRRTTAAATQHPDPGRR